MPNIKKFLSLRSVIHLLVPTIALVVFIARGYTVASSGMVGITLAFLLYLFNDFTYHDVKARSKILLNALIEAGKGFVLIALLGGCADIIIGMLSLTGLGVKLSSAIYSLSGGNILVALFFSMLVSIILGMGLPTTASYILASSVVVPALMEFGLLPIASHIFIFYFAAISAFTPPVCAAVYITSGIANSNWVKTGFQAMEMGIAAFLVPFIFMYSAELLMIGSWYKIIFSSITIILGTIMLAGGLVGNFFTNLNKTSRVLIIIAGIALVIPNFVASILGIALGAIIYIFNCKKEKEID